MSIDVGPFQQVIGWSSPLDDQWDKLIDGEAMSIRYDDCAESSEVTSDEYELDGPILFKDGGSDQFFCSCDEGLSNIQFDVYQFNIPHDSVDPPTLPWWDCVIGEQSGARIWQAWPEAPAGWPENPQPSSFNTSVCKAAGNTYMRQRRSGSKTWTVEFALVTACIGVCCP